MDYKKLRDAIWPIVLMRAGAYIAFLVLVLVAVLLGIPASSAGVLVFIAFLLYLLVYAYGG